ncbi:5-formyltetrahydrofolate cyclo-ligase [Metabacillus malikii]|uniref:5-formyltetrahydrofolate cyclo-ligase n=1 Tax=Metabacillus malikii TaxID=1504265 RepID=A0ABT9ZI78_9BACI|nr:5-formyltetrahydrofolate cyclo-ligase [Metabacillus malikii]MDQ0231983.1 5-formyltetrahydrofolate cyclo-ligase [Metabacillus malikii]
MIKSEVRRKMKDNLNSLTEETYRCYSERIHSQLFLTNCWKHAKTIATTISFGKEVDTTDIIKKAWKENKQVAVPKCIPGSHTMEFRLINSFGQIEPGYHNISEPVQDETRAISRSEIDLMVVPGVCFDRRGYRVGYGGGYYDRYLRNFNHHVVALAFSIQVVETVPFEEHDVPVPYIITEEKIIKCSIT